LNQEHEQLIEKILEDEELMIGQHRKHIDEAVDFAQKEMSLLNEVDKPGSDIQ
jgi:kinesin family protein 2/24